MKLFMVQGMKYNGLVTKFYTSEEAMIREVSKKSLSDVEVTIFEKKVSFPIEKYLENIIFESTRKKSLEALLSDDSISSDVLKFKSLMDFGDHFERLVGKPYGYWFRKNPFFYWFQKIEIHLARIDSEDAFKKFLLSNPFYFLVFLGGSVEYFELLLKYHNFSDKILKQELSNPSCEDKVERKFCLQEKLNNFHQAKQNIKNRK